MWVTKLILYCNYYLIVDTFSNLYYLIKLFANKFAFCKHLKKDNNKFLLLNFFANSIILLVKKTILAKYKNSLQGNWKTKKSSYNKDDNDDNIAKSNDNTIERQKTIEKIMIILIISYNNFSSHTLIYKLVIVKIKIKKVTNKLFYFYYKIYNFLSIIIYITAFHKYIKVVLLNFGVFICFVAYFGNLFVLYSC